VPPQIGWLKPRAIIRSLWAIRVAIKEKPDIVMAYCFFPAGLFALWAARLSGAAAIVQVAGGIREIESGGAITEQPLIPSFLIRRLVPLWQTLCNQFDGVVIRGHQAHAYIRQHSSPGRTDIIAGSVNPTRFSSRTWERTIDITFVGSIIARKQPDQLCQVVQRVARKHPDVRVAIAGKGPLLDDMKRWAKEMGIERNMRFLGHVEKVEGLLLRSRIFILTSRLEGLSIAMAEAMTAGTVPVVANIDDLGELVINGETGWLIPSGDLDGYAARICDLLENQSSWQKMSGKAQQIAADNNGLESITRRWQTCLDGVMNDCRLKQADSHGQTAAPAAEELSPRSAFPKHSL
jgi:glycosyltransferase involved in cell wall biosynthesis